LLRAGLGQHARRAGTGAHVVDLRAGRGHAGTEAGDEVGPDLGDQVQAGQDVRVARAAFLADQLVEVDVVLVTPVFPALRVLLGAHDLHAEVGTFAAGMKLRQWLQKARSGARPEPGEQVTRAARA
jgi:hypothetical protein